MAPNDLRIQWLKSVISNLMGIKDQSYAGHLIRTHAAEFEKFFNIEQRGVKDINQVVLFVWRTFYDKFVEEEITVLEEGTVRNKHKSS